MHNRSGITQLGITLHHGKAQITTWAPHATSVVCHTYHPDLELPLEPQSFGYWHAQSDQLHAGQLYRLVIDGQELPDPLSRAQPEGVHGPSAIVDLHFPWTDDAYQAPPLRDLIIYELHVGAFTPSHDFEGVIEKLPYLASLGVNAIELMPVAQYPGDRNWGYDGVYGFAVQHSYGGAKGLQKLVDACHSAGIAVILDVVYNHVGPEGNYLPLYGPYFTEKYHTPWGKAVNYDDAYNHGARDYVLENVQMWFRDFHIDGLRLDAVHAIKDFSPVHILQDIRSATDLLMEETGKNHYLIVECDLNDRRFLEPLDNHGFGMDAQWLDEFHHALRVAVGEDRKGYYAEFEGIKHLAMAYEQGYIFNGNYSSHRHQFFGSSAEGIPGEKFVVFSQNHDHIGNRMLGERSSMLYPASLQRLMAFALMVSPFVPLLFMGEEWASDKPFFYFVSHSDNDLIHAVQKGRKKEFADFHQEGEVPDPQSENTFQQSVLDWAEVESGTHKTMLDFYRTLIHLRKKNEVLRNLNRENLKVNCIEEKNSILLCMHDENSRLLCILNFSSTLQPFFFNKDYSRWQKILDTDDPQWGGNSRTPNSFQQDIVVSPQSGIIFQTII